MFPAWPASGPESNVSLTPAHSFSAPAGQHLPFPFTSHSGQPVNRKILFCSFGFPDAKTRGAYFFSIQNHRFRLGRPISANPLFIPAIQSPTQFISFRRQPADSLLSYFFTEPNASRHFFNIYKLPSSPTSSRRISAISTSPFRPSTHLPFSIFYIAAILPAFAFPYLQLQSHPTTLPTPSTSSVLLPLLQPAGQTRNVVSRAGAACKAAGVAGEEPAFLFLFFSSFPSPFPSPWRRGFAATPSFFFLLLFLFLFFLFFFLLLFLLFSFCFFLFIFLLIFYSCFFFALSFCFFFLFIFALIFVSLFFIFIFVLLLSLPSLFFLFVFLLSFYLCFYFSFLSFFLFYFFTLLTPISFLIIQPLADHSFFLFRRQSFPSHPSTSRQRQKGKKISAKESTGVRWPSGSERAAGGKTEGRNGAPRGMKKD